MVIERREIDEIKASIQTIDSKIGLIAQKIRTIEKNEEVLGRTLITLNQELKKVQERGGAAAGAPAVGVSEEVKKALQDIQTKFATKEELMELKYILDTINPLEFARITQVKELIEEKLGKASKEKKPPEAGGGLMERI